ncbi:chromate transporter [Tumebacillus flagellatus]|uniref:ChrA protein n=1 Tax=Tumebacillus flagellatus TaxID=1157490 RepID=A0A074LUB3_9BACL|nr:chromate transporter [Tumebacillus flagellatus]KEO84155.1 ChrA protein [Tumebacillus flagellatus]
MNGKALLEVLAVSFRLGLTSFGGPTAHLGYFRAEYVEKRKWLDERAYADLVALCQVLPGPASSQVGIAIGLLRAGWIGGILAWIGFMLPSALALAIFAWLLQGSNIGEPGWLHGLLAAAVAIVAQAVWGMAKSLAPDRPRATLALGAAILTLVWPSAWEQILLLLFAGWIGWQWLPKPLMQVIPTPGATLSKRGAVICLTVLAVLLLGLPAFRHTVSSPFLALFDSFFRVGSLVFGGGHVVLPMLQSEVVAPGWMSDTQFLAGYGAAQAVPGPLFTFAAYLGAVISGWKGALLATLAIFMPSYLLVAGALPFWSRLRVMPNVRGILNGVNAAVVGLLLAALYDPVMTQAIHSPFDAALALFAFGLLMVWKQPSWAVVLVCGVLGALL